MSISRKISTAITFSAIALVAAPAAAQAATPATPPATSGGVTVIASAVSAPGDPAPFELTSVRTPDGGPLLAGAAVPRGVVVVSARARVPAGRPAAGQQRSLALSCPTGMKVAGSAQPRQIVPLKAVTGIGDRDLIPGYSTSSRIQFDPGAEPVAFDFTLGILCRTPDARGSVAEHPRKLKRGERAGRICVDAEKLSRTPGLGFRTYVHRGQPVAVQRRNASGRWTQIVSDLGQQGWIRTSALCR